jgi:hypothetical protein
LGEASELQRRGEEYLKEKGLMPEDGRFDAVYTGAGDTNLVAYTQLYEGFSLYTSYIKLYFAGEHLTGFDYFWLEPLGFSGESRYVLPVTQALLRFLEIQGPARRPEEITVISWGISAGNMMPRNGMWLRYGVLLPEQGRLPTSMLSVARKKSIELSDYLKIS